MKKYYDIVMSFPPLVKELVLLCLFLLSCALIAPVIFTREPICSAIDFSATGQVGDTIGGTTAPFIGIIGAILTFIAFYIQYDYNKKQDTRIEAQDTGMKIDAFETRFYDLLKIHRENVSEISIKDVSKSRRAFISMFKEFRFCYFELHKWNVKWESQNLKSFPKLSEEELINISFITFLFGTGESSNKIVNGIFSESYANHLSEYFSALEIYKKDWKDKIHRPDERGIKRIEVKIETNDFINKKVIAELTTKYVPFEGHLSRLGHYFRHLFHIVKYIDEQDENTIIPSEKIKYVKTLRAQLSAHEQLLLHYNSLTVLGKPWVEKGSDGKSYIEKYKIIRNIPLPLADFSHEITDLYKDEDFFEWNEINKRLKELQSNK